MALPSKGSGTGFKKSSMADGSGQYITLQHSLSSGLGRNSHFSLDRSGNTVHRGCKKIYIINYCKNIRQIEAWY